MPTLVAIYTAGASSSGRRRGGVDAEKSDSEEDVPEKRSTRPVPAYRAGMSIEETKSVFHGKQQRDYQGRSWIEPPKGVRPDPDHDCFIPKKLIHTWTGHTKGVQVCVIDVCTTT